MRDKLPTAVDRVIGENIRLHRLRKRLSPAALGAAIGISGKLLQRYESGAVHVPADRLLQVAAALQVEFDALFEPPRSIDEFPPSPRATLPN